MSNIRNLDEMKLQSNIFYVIVISNSLNLHDNKLRIKAFRQFYHLAIKMLPLLYRNHCTYKPNAIVVLVKYKVSFICKIILYIIQIVISKVIR